MVREPLKAKTVAKLAIEIAARVHDTSVRTSARALLLEGKATYEYAAAILRIGQYDDAQAAVFRARHLFSIPETFQLVTNEVALLEIVHGQILHFLGCSDEGLCMIDEAADYLLLVCEDRKRYVAARTIAASVLMRLKRFDEADAVLAQTIDFATEDQDKETVAYMLHNIAICAAEKGDETRAQNCHEEAVALFEELGMVVEMPRARGAFIAILRRRGKLAEAISEFYKVRNDYIRLGMPLIAARSSMEIAELLLQANRYHEAEHLCSTLLDVFVGAQFHREIARSLKYLHECAVHQKLNTNAIQHVRHFLDSISSDDAAVFVPKASEGRP